MAEVPLYKRLATKGREVINASVMVSIYAKKDSIVIIGTRRGESRISIDNGAILNFGPSYISTVYVESGEIELYYGESLILLPPVGNVDVPLSSRASEATLSSIDSKIDVSLSSRASEATLSAIRAQTDKLTFDVNSFLRTALASDEVGIAKESTLSAILGQLDVALSTRASEATLSSIDGKIPSPTINGNMPVAIAEDIVNLAKETTLQAVRDRLPASLTAAGNLKTALQEDAVGLLKEATFTDKMSPTLLAENLATLDNSAGAATAAMDVFASNVTVPDSGELVLQIALDTAAVVKLRIVRGTNTLEYYINSGNSLAANAWHEFKFNVLANDAVNVVVEVPAGAVITAYAALILRKR